MKRRTTISIAILWLALAAAAAAANADSFLAASFWITEGDVLTALHDQGIDVTLSRLRLSSNIPAHSAHPLLMAERIEPLTPRLARVLMRCADGVSCIPFYAYVSGLDPSQRLAAVSSAASPLMASLHRGPSAPPLIKRGAHAILEITSPDMLITLTVVCLENGRIGDRIRVSLPDHSRTYMAEVVSPGLLKGRM
jgi:hypothetical protein